MEVITDKILEWGEMYENARFVRCLNLGADLKNCIWENGSHRKGTFKNGIWKRGIWKHGYWLNSIWENGVWRFGNIYNFKINKWNFNTSELPVK